MLRWGLVAFASVAAETISASDDEDLAATSLGSQEFVERPSAAPYDPIRSVRTPPSKPASCPSVGAGRWRGAQARVSTSDLRGHSFVSLPL